MKLLLLALMLIPLSCSFWKEFKEEKSVSYKKVPHRVKESFARRHPGIEMSFQVQKNRDVKTYEAHYKNGYAEFAERYSKDGDLIEVEKTISFDDVAEKARIKILKYFASEDSELERTKVQYVNSAAFTGYEIKAHTKKSSTGFMEYFFSEEGEYLGKEELKLRSIPNLN